MKKIKWLNLQLFAGEGASGGATGTGEGTGGTATSGENATAAAEQRLRELGVPEDKIRKRVSKVASKMPTTTQTETVEQNTEETNVQTTPAETTPTEENKETTPARMSWEEIMKDPEYNKQMQMVVQSRLKGAKTAEDNLAKLTPAVELLARKYNLDPNNMDYDALAKAISDDDGYYEEKALEMGVSVETAKKIDRQERDTAREQAQAQRTLQEQKIQQHFIKLEQQAEAMKKVFPNFDLRTELKNPAFARMTHPNVGISVEDAYYAVHRNEIQTAAMQVTAQKTAQKISNAIQSGSRRPDESGVSGQAPSVSTFNYRTASRDQREALKKRIRDAAARGEKLYPGQ
ncbi:MAG: hypothetical protein IJX51_08735 [Clostridia bacterium]|nr:hypothetical protein [Clostridia bacterium]